jgi:hypothetical protein
LNARKISKSTYRWRDRLTPYLHQVSNLITFCRRLPVTLLADDVGLGKTISAGLIISELIARSRLSKILIVCPKILAQQWKEELESKFAIPALIAFGKDLIDADPDETGAVITTYNSARLHLEKIPEDRFQMLVLDEAHKLRNLYGVQKTPEVTGLPDLGLCSKSGRIVPSSCLSKCEITGAEALRHLLVKSDVSGRFALPEFTVLCAQSGKRIFRDEAEISAVTGNFVSSDLLKESALSGKAWPRELG